MSVDSSKADQFQAPCFTSDTITQKPLQGGSRRAPQGGHADKLKFSLEKGHEATWKENSLGLFYVTPEDRTGAKRWKLEADFGSYQKEPVTFTASPSRMPTPVGIHSKDGCL